MHHSQRFEVFRHCKMSRFILAIGTGQWEFLAEAATLLLYDMGRGAIAVKSRKMR